MSFDKILSISGRQGLFEIKKEKGNGVIVKSLLDGKGAFVSITTHAFSTLSGISMYTDTDAEPLPKILQRMQEMDEAGDAPIDPLSSKDELKAYFKTVLPNYDEQNVYASDIKKLIKWYNLLKDKDMLVFEDEEAEGETGQEEE